MTRSRSKAYPCYFCSSSCSEYKSLCNHTTKLHINERWFKCSQCHRTFCREQDCQRHQETHHGIEYGYHCTQSGCSDTFLNQSGLNNHLRIRHELFGFQLAKGSYTKKHHCSWPNCSKTFPRPGILKNHLRIHQGLLFQCDSCPKRCTTSRSLRNHKKTTHLKQWKSVPCRLCGVKFYSNMTLLGHMARIHTKECAYSCEKCDMKFSASSDLSHHRRAHREGNIVNNVIHCKLCDKQYNLATSFLQHMKKHTRTEPLPKIFACKICEKKFSSKAILQSHITIHTGERPYKCSYSDCGRTFTQSGHCSEHIKRHMDIELGTLFPCPLCNEICRSRKILSHHKSYIHRKAPNTQPQKCYFCKKLRCHMASLRVHMKKHTLEFDIVKHNQDENLSILPLRHIGE